MLISTTRPVLLQVLYYMPSHPMLLNEFTWGFDDHVPQLLRTHRFLNHWKNNIDAVIAEVLISISDDRSRKYRSIDDFFHV